MISVFLFFQGFAISGCSDAKTPGTLHIAIPESSNVQDVESNYYINWLEEKTGYDLEFSIIKQKSSSRYLDALFASEADIDIVMFGEDFRISEPELQSYVKSGDIYVQGEKSYYENTGSTIRERPGQTFWINCEWLKALSLPVPESTDELEQVLLAFKEMDPNGNGRQDELPLVGSRDGYAYSPVEFIMNAFLYNDPFHSRFGINEELDTLLAASDEFREGLDYCHRLYEEALLDDSIWEGDHILLSELCNSEMDIVGGFTSDSISDVIYQGNPEILARYIHVSPLEGSTGERHSIYAPSSNSVGAIITERSNGKDQAVRLLDLMMSPEASLIARYGEQGVDWVFSTGADVGMYGGISTVTTINYIWGVSQNKHLNGIGPMDVPDEYLSGVTWNGINSDSEYINARAYMSYEDYLPEGHRFHSYDEKLSAYIDHAMEDFIRGNRDLGSDEEWKRYLDGLSH